MEVVGYFAAAVIGISLGLIGGGGSILTVPVLVYLFHVNAVTATSYSLFIVGVSSLVGFYKSYRKGLASIKIAMLFGISSVSTVFLIRKFVLPAIPENIITISGFPITRSMFTMVLFAILMILASVSMIRSGGKTEQPATMPKRNIFQLALYGIIIGLVTGFLGAGGGFLIIPALVLIIELDMKTAIGTSLLIIAMNSLIGFTGDLGHFDINWKFLLLITSISIAGIFAGNYLGQKIPGNKLKKGFGWFVLVMGIYIIAKELSLMLR